MILTSSGLADILILAIGGLFIFHVAGAVRKRRFFAFDPLMFFWVGAFVIYIMEALSNYDDYVAFYDAASVEYALFLVFLGILFLHLGYRLPAGKRLANEIPALPNRILPNRMLFLSLFFIGMGLSGWWMQIMTAGSFAAWAAVPRGGEDWANLSGYVTVMAGLLTVGVSLLVLHVELHRRGPVLRVVAWILLGLLLLFFLYLGTRSRTIGTVVVGLMAWSLPRRRNPSLIVMSVLFFCLLIVTNFQAEYRGHFRNLSFNLHEIDWSEVPSRVLPRILTGAASSKTASPGSELGMTVAVAQLVPDRIPYALGYEFVQIFTQPVPRALWPGKRYPRGEAWSEVHRMAGTSGWWVDYVEKPFLAGPSPGYIASWYYNGGMLGLLIGGLLTGVFLRLLRGIYDRSKNNSGFLVTYLMLAPIGFGEATGHPFSWIYSLPLILIPLIIALRLVGRKGNGKKHVRHVQLQRGKGNGYECI